jgi:peptidoglycan/xylan/chitin deacetylase (PgdA/CDA1 family)
MAPFQNYLCPVIWIALLLFFAFSGFMVYASAYIGSQVYVKAWLKGKPGQGQIAISFDDGPDRERTKRVLEVLRKHQIKASFFLIGKKIAGQEEVVNQLHKEGHLIGNHSFVHDFWYDLKNEKAILEDMKQCRKAIESAAGMQTKLYRPPYGVTTPNIGKAVKTMNMHTIGWSLRSLDTTAKTKEELLKRVEKVKDGDIILFHDTTEFMAEFLEEFIQLCYSKRLKIVGLDQLLGIECYE